MTTRRSCDVLPLFGRLACPRSHPHVSLRRRRLLSPVVRADAVNNSTHASKIPFPSSLSACDASDIIERCALNPSASASGVALSAEPAPLLGLGSPAADSEWQPPGAHALVIASSLTTAQDRQHQVIACSVRGQHKSSRRFGPAGWSDRPKLFCREVHMTGARPLAATTACIGGSTHSRLLIRHNVVVDQPHRSDDGAAGETPMHRP